MFARSTSDRVRERLEDYGAAARARMREYLRDGHTRHAFYELVSDYPERGGRALRASLCLATARAFGAHPTDALNSAVAIELLHNAFLVHDDLEDESEERRGHPTLHLRTGLRWPSTPAMRWPSLSLRPLIDNVSTLGSAARLADPRGGGAHGARVRRGTGARAGVAPATRRRSRVTPTTCGWS